MFPKTLINFTMKPSISDKIYCLPLLNSQFSFFFSLSFTARLCHWSSLLGFLRRVLWSLLLWHTFSCYLTEASGSLEHSEQTAGRYGNNRISWRSPGTNAINFQRKSYLRSEKIIMTSYPEPLVCKSRAKRPHLNLHRIKFSMSEI